VAVDSAFSDTQPHRQKQEEAQTSLRFFSIYLAIRKFRRIAQA